MSAYKTRYTHGILPQQQCRQYAEAQDAPAMAHNSDAQQYCSMAQYSSA